MPKPKPTKPKRLTYQIREEYGRYYVVYLRYAPVETIFDVTHTLEEAEKAIEDHKQGKHGTQWNPDKE